MEKINQPAAGTTAAGEPTPASPGWLDGPPPETPAPAAPTAGARFLASLPGLCRPDRHAITRLAPKVDALLAGGWSPEDLLHRLTGNISGVHNPPGVVIRRLEDLALPKGTPPPGRPPWCGVCDEHTRQRENDQGLPFRCPKCNPRAVSA